MEAGGPLEHLEGKTIAGIYRVVSLIGAGGGGRVYMAEQTNLHRRVAIKVLHATRTDADLARFQNEARAASRLNHPNAVAIYEFGVTDDGAPYIVMEYLRGKTLRELLGDEPLSIARAVRIASQVLSALDEAHECGIVHRDLKSDNIIVTQRRDGDDFVKVIDFGLAQIDEGPKRAKEVAGTPEYMAPEQIRGDAVDARTDLYAVGAVLYEMIVGRTPFAGRALVATLQRHLLESPVPPHQIIPGCPEEIGQLTLEALSKAAKDRPHSAGVMRDRLLDAWRRAPSDDMPLPARAGGSAPSATIAFGTGPWQAPGGEPVGRRQRRASLPVPFVDSLYGRDEELARVRAFYDRSSDRDCVALVGATGIGKSRLVEAVATSMAADVTTFFAGCDPTGLTAPWYPILSMLESVLGVDTQLDLEALAGAAARCGLPERDVPGLAELFGLGGPLETLELAVRRRETRAAALRSLCAVARRFPNAVLCFTDIHEFDGPSASLVAELSTAIVGSGVRLIVTADSAARVPQGFSIEQLPPLSDTAGLHMLGALATEVTLPTAEQLRTITGGLPGAIEQLGAEIAGGARVDTSLSGFEELATARICELPAAERRVLQCIAIHGTAVGRAVFDATIGLDDLPSAEVMQALTRARVIDASEERISFRSKLFADIVLASAPRAVRALLHSRALSAVTGAGAPAPTAVVAHHTESSGDLEGALALLMDVGDDAARRFDDNGARHWYSRALACARSLLGAGTDDADKLLVAAAVRLADVLRFSAQLSLAASVLDEAERAVLSAHPPPELVRAKARLQLADKRAGEAVETFRRCVGLAMMTGDVEFLCETYLDLAAALVEHGDPESAAKELWEGVDLVTKGDGLAASRGPDRLWLLGLRLAEFLLRADKLEEAEEVAVATFPHALKCASQQAPARILVLRADLAFARGDGERSLRYRARAIDTLRALGDRRSTAELLIASATLRLEPMQPAANGAESRKKALADARELATEIGWDEGVRLSEVAADA